MYHGIIVDKSFSDSSFPKTFKLFSRKQDGGWGIYGIEIDDTELDTTITKIQTAMKGDQPWYAHLYNDDDLIAIFKDAVFKVKPAISTWGPIVAYGEKLNIPSEQLDFWPNRFQDEIHYFAKEDFK